MKKKNKKQKTPSPEIQKTDWLFQIQKTDWLFQRMVSEMGEAIKECILQVIKYIYTAMSTVINNNILHICKLQREESKL